MRFYTEPLTLIHYGNTVYEPEKFKPIKCAHWNKPAGGLWTSPINTSDGWFDWCLANEFRHNDKSLSFQLSLIDKKVCIIDSLEDLISIEHKKSPYTRHMDFIDYELLATQIDAIYLTDKGQCETRFSTPNLYGWDCECVLILNPNAITLL